MTAKSYGLQLLHLLISDDFNRTSRYVRIERQEYQQKIKIGMEEQEIGLGLTAGLTSPIFWRHGEFVPYLRKLSIYKINHRLWQMNEWVQSVSGMKRKLKTCKVAT